MDIIILNFILILLIIFIFYIGNCYIININKEYTCENYKIYKKILYSNIKNELKTGDLLFFDHNLTFIHERTFGHQQFAHVGMVVKINNELYSYEISPEYIEQNILDSNYGVKLIPLYECINNYAGNVFIVSLKNKLSLDKENIIISQINNKKYHYLSDYKIFLLYLLNSRYIYKNEMVCSEFIAKILDDVEITNNISKSKKKELTTNVINLSNSNIYHNPIHIILDDLIIKNLNSTDYKFSL